MSKQLANNRGWKNDDQHIATYDTHMLIVALCNSVFGTLRMHIYLSRHSICSFYCFTSYMEDSQQKDDDNCTLPSVAI